jgi:2-hydroxy-6-oxo-octa-2,4-dienoate hydrolase
MSIEQAKGRSIQAAGLATNYHEMGEGTPVLMLHGSGAGVSAWENWQHVMPAFAEQYRVIAPDIVGFGLTERPAEPKFNIKVWVQHFLGILDALGIEKAHVVGNSFGGALAMATAISNPHRINKLVLMGTPAGEFDRVNRSSSWNYEPSEASMRDLLLGFPHDPSFVTDEMVQARYQMTLQSDTAYRKLFAKPEEGQTTTRAKGIPEKDLTQIQHPVLVLHGREDSVVPMECGLRIATHCPNAEMHLFGHCGHWVQIERRQEFVRLAMDFFAKA